MAIEKEVIPLLALIAIMLTAVLVLMIVAQWQLFEKAGEPGWKSLIPFYSGYVWFSLTWSVSAWVGMIALGIVT